MGFMGLFQFALECFDVLAWPLFALGYPLCASIKAIETNSNSDTQKLITYWVSFSLILLFECAFEKQLQWLTLWAYAKLMIVGCLVVPHFDGSLYVYKHLVHPCLSMDSRIVVSQFNKLKELLFKKDDFVVEVKRYVKENGPDALENLIVFKKKSAHSDVAVKEIKALATEDSARQIESNIPRAVHKASVPLEIKETATAALTGRDIFEMSSSEKVQKYWSCAICQVTTQSEKVLNSHLQGKRHKAVCELLKSEASAASVGKKPNIPIAAPEICVRVHTSKNAPIAWTCVVCGVTVKSQIDIHAHLQGKGHKNAFKLLTANNKVSNSKVSLFPAAMESNVHGKESENCTSSCSISPEIRNGKWWCTVCNISCTCEGNMKSHFFGSKHLAKMRKLSDVGGGGHA